MVHEDKRLSEDPSWNPKGSNGDLLPFCFHMLNSASRLLAVKGFMLRLLKLFEALRGSLGAVVVSKAFKNPF